MIIDWNISGACHESLLNCIKYFSDTLYFLISFDKHKKLLLPDATNAFTIYHPQVLGLENKLKNKIAREIDAVT